MQTLFMQSRLAQYFKNYLEETTTNNADMTDHSIPNSYYAEHDAKIEEDTK